MDKFNKKIEFAANCAILVLAGFLAVVVVKDHLLGRGPKGGQSSTQLPQNAVQPAKGMQLSSLDVDWKQSKQTLVLALSSYCHFCTESAPFYKTLTENKKNTRIIAVLPQSVEDGKNYLQGLGVSVDDVRQLPLSKIGVRGTPTLLLVDSSGAVQDSWIGKLPAIKETAVLDRLRL